MTIALNDAPVNTELTLLQVSSASLAAWLQRLGLFVGSTLMRHNEEMIYHPVRVTALHGDVVVPAGLASKVLVHLDEGDRLPLVEMTRGTTGHIETMTCGMGCVQALSKLGLKEEVKVTCVRQLPHMDYLTIIDRRARTRITEGEAAHIWGRVEGEKPTQFYFTRQGQPFEVLDVIGGQRAKKHLNTHGITPGKELILETIEQANELHKPSRRAVIITSPGGLRLYLDESQARQVVVKRVDHPARPTKKTDKRQEGL